MTDSIRDQRQHINALDRAAGARVREARERMGYSQQIVAAHLKLLGIEWHQTTVGKVESGERPLRLTEAVALASALNTTLQALVYGREGNPVQEWERLMAAAISVGRINRAVQDEMRRLTTEAVAVDDGRRARERFDDIGVLLQGLTPEEVSWEAWPPDGEDGKDDDGERG